MTGVIYTARGVQDHGNEGPHAFYVTCDWSARRASSGDHVWPTAMEDTNR
jgi:hypothetical protein